MFRFGEQSRATKIRQPQPRLAVESFRITGLANSHAYSVVGYDKDAGIFTVVDPNKVMELQPTQGDGIIHVTAGQIRANFMQSIVETENDILWSVFSL